MTRTITTAEELDALPLKTIVMDAHQRGFQKFTNGWEPTGIGQAFSRCATPATVLYEPGETLPDDAQVERIAAILAGATTLNGGDFREIIRAAQRLARPLPDRDQIARAIHDAQRGCNCRAVYETAADAVLALINH